MPLPAAPSCGSLVGHRKKRRKDKRIEDGAYAVSCCSISLRTVSTRTSTSCCMISLKRLNSDTNRLTMAGSKLLEETAADVCVLKELLISSVV